MDFKTYLSDFFLRNVVTTKTYVSKSTHKQISDYIAKKYPLATLIYTDGSRSSSGRTGAAVYVPSLNIKLSYRLSDRIHIDMVELDAIFSAISLISVHRISNPLIITDSLHAVTTFSRSSIFDNSLVHICRDIVTNIDTSITLLWVPSHVGLIDHNFVDDLAKSALDLPSINRVVAFDLTGICVLLKDHYINLWNSSVLKLSAGRAYHTLFPNGRSSSENLKPRKKDTTITRLRLNNCRLNQYMHKIGLRASSLCDTCNISEDVAHFLFQCRKHGSLTSLLQDAASAAKLSLSLALVLSQEPFLSIIYNYISVNSIAI